MSATQARLVVAMQRLCATAAVLLVLGLAIGWSEASTRAIVKAGTAAAILSGVVVVGYLVLRVREQEEMLRQVDLAARARNERHQLWATAERRLAAALTELAAAKRKAEIDRAAHEFTEVMGEFINMEFAEVEAEWTATETVVAGGRFAGRNADQEQSVARAEPPSRWSR